MLGSAAFRTGIAPGGALAGPWVRDPLWTRARAVPSLDLRFADNKSLVDATAGASLVTFTRASSGTYVGSDGVLRSAVTNLLTNSESLTTGFSQQNTTVTSDATTAPDGTTTADLSVPNATSGSHASFRTSITFAVSTSYAMSVFVKPSGYTNFQLAFTSGFNNTNAWANFVLVDNGSLGFTGTSGTATIQALNNGWYRCSLVATSGASATTGGPALLVLDSDRNSRDPSFAGNNTSGLFIWGAQLEQSATVGDYIPTTSTINSAPRFDHNPTTGESLGLLVEEARTNLLLNSATLSTQSVTVAAAANTLSFYGTGTVTLTGVSTAGPLVGTGANNRVSLTFTPTVGVLVVTVSGSVTNAQLEAGAFATSYIPTTTATVTRAADVASITGSNFSSWYNQTEGTVFSDSNIIASQVQTQTVWQLGGGTILSSLRQPQGTSNQFRALIGGTFTASPGTGGLLSAGTSKAGVAYLGTAGRLQVASSGVDSTGSSLDANKLDIGSLNPGSSLNGTIKRITYWPVRLANTTIQSITAP